jgi:hypothetical protein
VFGVFGVIAAVGRARAGAPLVTLPAHCFNASVMAECCHARVVVRVRDPLAYRSASNTASVCRRKRWTRPVHTHSFQLHGSARQRMLSSTSQQTRRGRSTDCCSPRRPVLVEVRLTGVGGTASLPVGG